jgi:hypothetical protein
MGSLAEVVGSYQTTEISIILKPSKTRVGVTDAPREVQAESHLQLLYEELEEEISDPSVPCIVLLF